MDATSLVRITLDLNVVASSCQVGDRQRRTSDRHADESHLAIRGIALDDQAAARLGRDRGVDAREQLTHLGRVSKVFTSQLAGFGDDMYAVQVSAYAPTGEMWTRRWNGADADYGHDVDARDGLVVVSGAVEGEVDLGAGPPLATHDFFFLHLVP
jgi:hypothetical protein